MARPRATSRSATIPRVFRRNNPWAALVGAYGAGGCGASVDPGLPGESAFKLHPPFPNPAHGAVTLSYELGDPEATVDILC